MFKEQWQKLTGYAFVIELRQISKDIGGTSLLHDADLKINQGDRIGLVGPNGLGKTTLFRLIVGEIDHDSGDILKNKFLNIGYLPQEVFLLEGNTILETVCRANDKLSAIEHELDEINRQIKDCGDKENTDFLLSQQGRLQTRFEAMDGYSIEHESRRVLMGLGFKESELLLNISQLSGGWSMRVALARILVLRPDLLLLDEPTNHLDLPSTQWLEDYLVKFDGAFVLISHDRTFLNKVTNRILTIEAMNTRIFKGNYDAYLMAKKQELKINIATREKQDKEIERIHRFAERFRYNASKSKQVQKRLKELDKIQLIDIDKKDQTIAFDFPAPPHCGRVILEASGLKKGFGVKNIFSDLDFNIIRGNKIALTGPNGEGKTTLLRILAKSTKPDHGDLKYALNINVGYFSQNQLEMLNPDATVLEEVLQEAGFVPESRIRALLGTFLFKGGDVFKKINILSGGEKTRLLLAKLLINPPNLLLLDEPTNHLDMASREVLTQALKVYPGSFLLVTHDRYLIANTSDTIWYLKDGTLQIYPGDFEYFETLQKKEALQTSENNLTITAAQLEKDKNIQKRIEAEARNKRYRELKPLRKRLLELEMEMESGLKRKEEIHLLFTDPATYQDGDKAKQLNFEIKNIEKTIDSLMLEWEEITIKTGDMESG